MNTIKDKIVELQARVAKIKEQKKQQPIATDQAVAEEATGSEAGDEIEIAISKFMQGQDSEELSVTRLQEGKYKINGRTVQVRQEESSQLLQVKVGSIWQGLQDYINIIQPKDAIIHADLEDQSTTQNQAHAQKTKKKKKKKAPKKPKDFDLDLDMDEDDAKKQTRFARKESDPAEQPAKQEEKKPTMLVTPKSQQVLNM